MLRAEEAQEREEAFLRPSERPEKERLAGVIEPGDDEWRYPGCGAHMALPGGQQVEALVGGRERAAVFEAAPERLRRRHVLEDLDASDLGGAPRACGRRTPPLPPSMRRRVRVVGDS